MTRNLYFQLEVDDGWPPVSVEVMSCEEEAGGYLVKSPPIFIKGISVGDVITANPDSEGRVWEWQHLSQSMHTTIWLARLEEEAQTDIDEIVEKLRGFDCRIAEIRTLGCYSVDVPPQCPIDRIDEVLDDVDAERIAVAFPSFRHPDETDEGDE
jgi:hypothetical protein